MTGQGGSGGSRREPALAAGLCLLGSCVVLVAASRTWVELPVEGGPLLPDRRLDVRGSELVPGVRALALVGLAGVVALLATRRTGRVVVGGLLALCGAGVVASVVRLLTRLDEAVIESAPAREAVASVLEQSADANGWLAGCLLGGLVLAAAGVLVALRGPGWAAMSRRYEPPAARAEQPADPTERSLWEALDRGEDPTQR